MTTHKENQALLSPQPPQNHLVHQTSSEHVHYSNFIYDYKPEIAWTSHNCAMNWKPNKPIEWKMSNTYSVYSFDKLQMGISPLGQWNVILQLKKEGYGNHLWHRRCPVALRHWLPARGTKKWRSTRRHF
jgi:hypothetical protein